MKYRWYDYPLAVLCGPFILGVLLYADWSNRRWAAQRLREQEAWARGDRTPWGRS